MTRILFLPITPERLSSLFECSDPFRSSEVDPPNLFESVSCLAIDRILAGTKAGKPRSVVLDKVEVSVIAPLFESASADFNGTKDHVMASLWRSHLIEPGIKIVDHLDKLGVKTMSRHEVERERFLTPHKRLWRKEYRDEATREALEPAKTINADGHDVASDVNTARTMSQMIAELGESGSVQGVAGCGKTHSLTGVVAKTPRDKSNQILVLTLTWDQARSTYRRLKKCHVEGLDQTIKVDSIRNYILEIVMRTGSIGYARKRASYRYHVEENSIARSLGVQSLSQLNRKQVIEAIIATVNRFCYSPDWDIGPHHCPDWVPLADGEVRILVENARVYWKALQNPTHAGIGLPLRLTHLWKIAEMRQLPVAEEIASIVVDEAHDLPAGVIRWLRSLDGVGLWLVGDEFQHYGAHSNPFFMMYGYYHQTLTHSYRCGRDVEDFINPILEKHPLNKKVNVVFEGHPNDNFRVRRYGRNHIPPDNTVVVCANEADCLEYVFRLQNQGVEVALFGRTRNDVPAYLRGLVGLYLHGRRPRMGSLWRYQSWDQLISDQPSNKALIRIQDMFVRGFGDEECERFCRDITQSSGGSCVWLALPVSIKNSEFQKVQISRALLHGARDERAKALMLAQVYTAETRTSGELIIPGEYRDWLASFN